MIMETLIIILIVVMIAQACIFIYANFIEVSRQRELCANAEIIEGAQNNFLDERAQYKRNLEMKDHVIQQWIDRANKLDFELAEARKVNGLLKNRTAYVEGLKDSFNLLAENEWEGIAPLAKAGDISQRRCFVEGVKIGAKWICKAVGVKVEFEIDGRFEDPSNETDMKE